MAALVNPELVIETEVTALVQLVAGKPHEFEARRRLHRLAEAAIQCADQAEAATRTRRRRTWLSRWLPTLQFVVSWS